MKKFIVTILAVLYLGVSSGATVHFHYCMGRLVEWGLISKSSEKCSKCGMKAGSTKNCCKKEKQQIKISEVQKEASQSNFLFKSFSTHVTNSFYLSPTDNYVSTLSEEFPLMNAPPKTGGQPTFLLFRNFRI